MGTGDDKSVQISSGGYCKGSSCAAGDVDTCCDVLCNDKKKGFKTADDKTGKQPNTCAKGEIVSSTKFCKGGCKTPDTEDKKACCTKAVNATATTDASSTGLGAVIGVLILMSATAS